MTADLVEPTPPPRSKSEKRKRSKEILTSPTDAQQFIENLVNQVVFQCWFYCPDVKFFKHLTALIIAHLRVVDLFSTRAN